MGLTEVCKGSTWAIEVRSKEERLLVLFLLQPF